MLPSINQIEAASKLVYSVIPSSPQYCWPLLCEQLGVEL